jgi:hypothetical protein
MTFLSPHYLWFLSLISLPVIIHLLAKQKSKQIDFPSLIFLKQLEQDSLRKFNIKQLILLIIRTLMILLIILAFARPNLETGDGFGFNTEAVDLLLIILDNTASNSENFDSQNDEWLKEFGQNVEEKGTKVYFCGVSDLEIKSNNDAVISGYSAIYSGDFGEKLSKQLDLPQYRRKSILWIGDGQDVNEALLLLPDWKKYVLWESIKDDVGLFSIKLPPRSLLKDDLYSVGVELGNNSKDLTMSLEFSVNDRRVNQTIVTSEDHFVELSTRVTEPGPQEGVLEFREDEYSFNNVRYFVLSADSDIPVQIISSNNSPDYWNIIKSSMQETNVNLDLRLLDYGSIDELNINRAGTIIVDDASKLAGYSWRQLETFISNGGQLILFGSGGPNMQELLGFKDGMTQENNQLPFGLFYTTTARQNIKTTPLGEVITKGRLKVYRRYNISSGELDETWIRYFDEQPFLGVKYLQKGRVVWFNTDFAIEANNLPLLGSFPPLILELCQFQSMEGSRDPNNMEVGDTLRFYPSAQKGGKTLFSLQRPDGTVDYQQPDSNFVIHYTNTDIPGVYRFMGERQVLKPIAVNITPHEARAHLVDYNFDDTDIAVHEDRNSLMKQIMEERVGTALWPIILIILLLLWMSETYLSRIKSTWRQND